MTAPLRLGVNTLFYLPGEVGGTETYLRETLRALVSRTEPPVLVLFTNAENDGKLRGEFPQAEFAPLGVAATRRPARILAEQFRLPRLVRFVSEFGALAVPTGAGAAFAEPGRWPDLDRDRLEQVHALQQLRLERGEKPAVDPSVFSNAYVLVGVSAPGLMDVRPTPVSRVMPGVEVHAAVLDNLLTGDFLRDPPRAASALYALLAGWAAAGLVLLARRAGPTALAYLVMLPLPVAAAFGGYSAGYGWPLMLGLLSVTFALVGATLVNYATEGRQRAFIRNAFRYYLGDEVIEQILSDPSLLKLGGEKREMTVFFSDIESFSSFSEKLAPDALTALLNDYLSDMGAIIREEGGYLDKYIGDAIVAFWNAPVAQPDHAARACRAALKCQRRLAERREEFEARTGVALRARIGINTGVVTVGNMGSYERFNYTVLGDAANLASRLEGANKAFGTTLMVSESTWLASGGSWAGRELALLRVVGRQTPVRVFELAGFPGEARPESWAGFDKGRALFECGRYAEALDEFARWPDDAAARAYAARCARLAAQPPAGQNGVWELSEK